MVYLNDSLANVLAWRTCNCLYGTRGVTSEEGEGEGLPCLFLKIEESDLILEKDAPIEFVYWLNFWFKMLFWQYLGEKTPIFLLAESFFHVL